jgi:tRNA pseudouridine13 synthase
MDREIGIEVYASQGPPCTARAKSLNEDFEVEESLALEEVSSEARPGYFPLYRVEKSSIDTLHMERQLSDMLRSRVTYGGLKDKRAVAVQYVTPTSRNSARPESIVGEKFSARLVGYLPRPISRGSMVGNRFRITLRGCCSGIEKNIEEVLALARLRRLPNFFGYQRFGAPGMGTHRVGRAIVRRDFAEAVRLMLSEPRPQDDEETAAAREEMVKGNYGEGLRMLPPHQDTEGMVARELERNPSDFVGALRAVPVRLRRLFVQAYQSFIFNRTVSIAVSKGFDISNYERGDNWGEPKDEGLAIPEARGARDPASPGAVPMVQLAGYAFRDYGSRFDALANEVMYDEGVSAKDFYIREMQETSAEGGFRIPHLLVGEASYRVEGTTAVLGFSLARGQYATVLLREIIKPTEPRQSGLV